MGYVSSFGQKLYGAVNYLGQKAEAVVTRGRKFVHDYAKPIEKGAKVASKVGGFIGNVATAALPFTAGIPGVGEVVGGLAAGGKFTEAAGKWVAKGARTAGAAESAYEHAESAVSHGHHAIDDLRRGQIVDTYKEGEKSYDELKKSRKDIERMRKK